MVLTRMDHGPVWYWRLGQFILPSANKIINHKQLWLLIIAVSGMSEPWITNRKSGYQRSLHLIDDGHFCNRSHRSQVCLWMVIAFTDCITYKHLQALVWLLIPAKDYFPLLCYITLLYCILIITICLILFSYHTTKITMEQIWSGSLKINIR